MPANREIEAAKRQVAAVKEWARVVVLILTAEQARLAEKIVREAGKRGS